MKKKVTIWFLVLTLLLPLFPAALASNTYNYAVEGGNLEFDPSTGTIVERRLQYHQREYPQRD